MRTVFKNVVALVQKTSEVTYRQHCKLIATLQSHPLRGHHLCHSRRFKTAAVLRDLRIVQAVPYDAYGVRIIYSDGTKNDFRYIWLRDCCGCDKCFDQKSRFRLFNTNDLDLDIKPAAMWVTDEGDLGIKWPKDELDHRSIFQSKWLQRQGESSDDGNYAVVRDTSNRPAQFLWDRGLLESHGLPQLTYGSFFSSGDGLKQWMELFYKYGFVILRDVPLTKEALFDVANHLSYIRPTCGGPVLEDRYGPHYHTYPDSAMKGQTQPLHNDLVYKERSPGIILFHFLQAADPETVGTDAGGQTLLSDGFFAAKWLKEKLQTYFQSLAAVPVSYGFHDPTTGVYYSSYWPVIGIDPLGKVEEIHHCPATRQPLKMPSEEILPFYEALVEFGNKLHCSQVPFYMRQGDLLAVNNRRILHGQTAFDPSKVTRYTRICYLDLDEILYKYDSLSQNDVKQNNSKNSELYHTIKQTE